MDARRCSPTGLVTSLDSERFQSTGATARATVEDHDRSLALKDNVARCGLPVLNEESREFDTNGGSVRYECCQ